MTTFKFINLAFILFSLIGFESYAQSPCQVTKHALYDIGSGSTKISVVEKNSCEKGLKTLFKSSEKVDYKEDLLKNKNSEFSEAVQKSGLEALKKLKAEAVKLEVKDHEAVATAAFREAKNAAAFTEKIKNELSVPVRIITQEEEAELAYKAVQHYYAESSLLVWDIGGSSFQITHYDSKNKKWSIFKGALASVVFKDKIIQSIKKSPDLNSPNPFTSAEIAASRKLLQKELSPLFKESFLHNHKFKTVVGIGGVFAMSVKRYLGKDAFTVSDIDQWILANHRKTDVEINDKYAATVISNMILVSEMMKLLKIKRVEVSEAALVEGLLDKI